MNTVDELLKLNYLRIGLDDKFRIKALGRPTPRLVMEQKGQSHGCEYMRKFSLDFYTKYDWLCGCTVRNALFCFPCLLFGGEPSWTKTGVRDLRHFQGKAKKHEISKVHMNNVLNLNVLGKVRLCALSDAGHAESIRRYNEEVKKNRAVLSSMIDIVKFCGEFELRSRCHPESPESNNPGEFRGLLEYTAKLDPALRTRLDDAVFKSTSITAQNDLLDCIFQIYQECVVEEITDSQFLSVVADVTTDVSSVFQVGISFRYEVKGNPVERFWAFVKLPHHDAETLSLVILHELENVLGEKKDKLIAQSYDGAISAMSGRETGVQVRVRGIFPNAHFVRYAHQAKLFVEQVAASSIEVKVFFSDLAEIPSFFSGSPQHSVVLDNALRRRQPGAESKWNFKISPVKVIYENRESLIECFENLERSPSTVTAGKASSLFRMLQDRVFVFWLTLFYNILPGVEKLFKQLQRRHLTAVEAKTTVIKFASDVQRVRDDVDQIAQKVESLPNVCNFPRGDGGRENLSTTAKEVCDIITTLADQFLFTSHLSAAKLLSADAFQKYDSDFPEAYLLEVVSAYPMLDKFRIRSQLEVLYGREDCQSLTNAMLILQFIVSNNVERTFSEIAQLVRIILTTPMSVVETERSSALQRVKTSLRSTATMTGDHLNARTVLAVEKSFIDNIDRLNELIIDRYATTKDHRIDLTFKSV